MVRTLRCAIYTRKSSEEGLEQGFNSLHAQREACEAYVLSQAGEGWKAIGTHYDDGGCSGGSIDRPDLARLLADVDAGLIDIVVVYKVDRLTRSLSDFSKIVEQFDAQNVSFVSVTQAFNTTSSMGRLTLNVLLSFAQFEREVTGERIRDKIAASKAKGMWMGGNLPLGYDAPVDPATRALVVNEAEAATIRLIFQRYLELGSVHALRDWLEEERIHSKVWTTRKGRPTGGRPFRRGALFHLLKNRVYLGEITHRGCAHPGAHPAIVEAEVFERANLRLAAQATLHHERPTRVATMPLRGKIFDAEGEAMSPTFTYRPKGRAYRYYVSARLQQGGRCESAEVIRRVSAPLVEGLVADALKQLIQGEPEDGLASIARVEIHASSVEVLVRLSALLHRSANAPRELHTLQGRLGIDERLEIEPSDSQVLRLILPRRLKVHGGRTWIHNSDGPVVGPSEVDPVLIRALRKAHALVAEACGSPIGRPEQAKPTRGLANPYDRALTRLAFLAPDIQGLILEGRQPRRVTLQHLLRMDLPTAWDDQRRVLGLSP